MFVIALLALALLATSVALAIVAASVPRVRTAQNLGQIGSYGYAAAADGGASSSRQTRRRLDSLAAAVGGAAGRRLNALREDEVQRRLIAAGLFTLGARRFLGYQVLLTIALPVAAGWLLVIAGASPVLVVLFVLVGAMLGWVGPQFYLGRRGRLRLQRIDDDLPELIDLLVVTVEAGVGFTASMRMAADRLTGPLGDELRLTLQEQTLGLSTLDAMENWLLRCDTPAVRSFVRSMVQGERLGVSIGSILRNLALEMRKRRRQAAEERAQRAPIKILFPLVFLIFPAMFVIVLGPALYRIGDTLGGG